MLPPVDFHNNQKQMRRQTARLSSSSSNNNKLGVHAHIDNKGKRE